MAYPTEKEIMALRSQLEHGDIQKIADKLGLHRSTVNKVLTNKTRNFSVIEAIINLTSYRNGLINRLNKG